jgi:Protein of unknown function (DUF2917)
MHLEHATMKPTTTHELAANGFLHLHGQPVLLLAEAGTLWVTEDGNADDHQLDAGQHRRFDGRAALTVGTLGGRARVRVVPLARSTAWPRRAWPRWLLRGAPA